PPKRTRAKKSVKEEVDDDLPSLSIFRGRGVDPDALFAPPIHSTAIEFGELMNDNLQWIFQCKEDLKKICQDFGGTKTVPKTPKRETAFSKIKDTINMFDNLALTQIQGPQQQRVNGPLVLDNAVAEDEDEEGEERENQAAMRRQDIKTDNSPAVRPITPVREIKEEVVSDGEEEVKPRRGRSRKEAKTPVVSSQGRRGRSTRNNRDVEMRDDSAEISHPRTNRVQTPSSMVQRGASPARTARSPARENAVPRVQAIKKTAPRMGGNDSQSSSVSSPSKTLRNTSKNTEDEEAKRAERMRKLEEKGKAADHNREEAIRERAERARREREERNRKVQAKKAEEEKEIEKKRMEIKERERTANELRKRQAQSPVRGGEKGRQGTRTPTRVRVKSPEGRTMKRVMETPLTPRVPVKQHRVHSAKKTVAVKGHESEEEEMERERELKRQEKERRRRVEEEREMRKKMMEEEERVAKLKEEQRRREEEKRERERKEREREERDRKDKEKERRMREEEEKMKTPALKNKHLANVSMNDSQNSYEMTPDKIYVAATETNYGVDDLDSGDDTDDENNPRKKVPKWASQPQLNRTLASIRHEPPFDPDVFFGPIIEPDLNIIFKASTSKYPKRTSSAMWNSPLSNPTIGSSRLLNHH
ncbi:hypothetical protein PMAYCL1PPCAC_06857, partial [Pristionchus mayeri]